MEAASSYDRNDTCRSAKNGSTKNNREQEDEKNNSNLLTIYSFISSYVFKEDMNYDENDSRYELLESQDLENEGCEKKVSFSEYNEKVYRYYRGRSGSEHGEEADNDDEDDEEEEEDDEEDEEVDDDDHGDDDGEELDDEESDCNAHTLENANEEDVIVQGSVPRKKKRSKRRRKKGIPHGENHMISMKEKKYKNKLCKKEKKNKIHNVNEDYREAHNNGPIKKNINNISKYFMLSMDNINEQENIFKDEKQLSRQMSYYNDAYYYTSEMIYKNNKRHKEKFALYLRLMSLFVNIMIGIYLITHFPHTNNEFEMNSQNGHYRENENLKEIIRNTLFPAKSGAATVYEDNVHAHMNALTSQSEVLQNNEKKRKYLDILFRGSTKAKEKGTNAASPWKDENSVDDKKKDKEVVVLRDNSSNHTEKRNKTSEEEISEFNNPITDIDIVNIIHDEYIMQYIYLEMNKIYKYAVYSFFGELLVISIIVFSLFILRIIIKDNNKFSVILTMYGILYKIFCYIFAHYVLVMGLYILSIYYNIYRSKDISENNFNFFCYHYVCNNLHIHLLMLFYAFQNIIFTINDTFNCIRMMFIIVKHIIVRIYEKITCKNFITFYELKEDKSPLSLNCMNKFKKKCNMNNKCCRDKTCVEIDIDEIHELEYDKSQMPFPSLHQKPYCKNLDIKTYEQSLLNMRNPIFK
ncbi:conserved Plasmodium protein, unknown function [Plasmodium knowlesi strain H]|uniref:Uncharacterized protein n=3 Tax=Plasmodium knowlesi TaxID=5850 RepID=A0A5K1TVX3_PLAKH|nr:conserved Plasmodium protein, unknown function [Plasmodium knowlesi strain H]OTN64051.1 Uncharacterized protein PKNOH_S140225500 [Plasmodium knowlesi]CAA9990683.1 conserved Plasmodium protein, unknown function [Plasmodium knowlesi strain H]SBO25929.1 conserved Plasmodium protein, unknown function [Plasmodium knowlesi strain H]SBO28675.1 conserved Plasmodium protein, unknown function [Plasmodium knowlesi strain H]VVS80157.1 conserved Plasmodium protein, unknown function [Plasmodium knowlesi |eukprot:XP_002261973.1 hypothetical protein, conserved in Plasmodium species [Plasmodium knowlesi strain H]